MSIPEGKYQIISVSTKYPDPPSEDPALVVSSGVYNTVTIQVGSNTTGSDIWHVAPDMSEDGLYDIRAIVSSNFSWGPENGNIQAHANVVVSPESIPWKLEVEPANDGYLTTIRPGNYHTIGVDVHVGLHKDQLQIHFVPIDFEGDRAKWFFRPVKD